MTRGSDAPGYEKARTIGGLLLLGAGTLLMLIDAVLDTYAVDSIQLGLLLGTGSVLLGVEAIRNRFG